MRKLILALFLCATLTVPTFAATPPPSETLSSIPAIASEAPSGVGDLTETPAENKLSPETKKLIVAAVGSGIIAGTAMVYIFKKKER